MRRLKALLFALPIAAMGLTACEPPPPPPVVITPSNAQTVADSSQVTGLRVNLPLPDCTVRPSDCNELRLLNQFDGFDVDPRISVTFTSPVDPAKVNRSTVYLHRVGDATPIGLRRLVVAGSTIYGNPETQLQEGTTYEIVVTAGVNGQTGRSTFTTMTATRDLAAFRAQLDRGTAYTAAGIPADQRGLDFVIDGQRRVYSGANLVRPRRFNDTRVGTGDALVEETVFDSSTTTLSDGIYAFGSFWAPQWVNSARYIPRSPSGSAAPSPTGRQRVGFVLIVPQATLTMPEPAGGWPVAVFGPGVTRSKYDVFLAADENLKRGIATIAIDPVGHAYGPDTQTAVDLAVPPSTERFSGFGR
ncbi:MAG: Ig-like domain-containing protein, partial [Actinomycetota bacterium]|nr:Ig-like domain-containing protein [Actinomycetota bacterium]